MSIIHVNIGFSIMNQPFYHILGDPPYFTNHKPIITNHMLYHILRRSPMDCWLMDWHLDIHFAAAGAVGLHLDEETLHQKLAAVARVFFSDFHELPMSPRFF